MPLLPLLPLLPRQWLLLLVWCMRVMLRGASWRCIPLLWRASSMLLLLVVVRCWLMVLLVGVRCWLLARSLALLVGWRWVLLLIGLSGRILMVALLVLPSRSLLPWLLLVLLWLIVVLRWPLLRRRQRLVRCSARLRLRQPLLEARGPSACRRVLLLLLLLWLWLSRTCRVEQCTQVLSRRQVEQTPGARKMQYGSSMSSWLGSGIGGWQRRLA